MEIRKAKIDDAEDIQKLITFFADDRKMLPRSLNFVFENIRDFWVAEDDSQIIGCAALSIVGWDGLAEIKSLSVKQGTQKKGLGRSLVETCLNEAKPFGIKKVFALTFVPEFFEKCGFDVIDKESLPHKIWTDCIDCPMFNNCEEIAVELNI